MSPYVLVYYKVSTILILRFSCKLKHKLEQALMQLAMAVTMQENNGLKSCQSYNGTMEMDCPLTCKYALAQDGKQRMYLEWPNW